MNLACALLVKITATEVKTIVLVRVTINDTLFVLCAISLSVCLYKVAKMSLASIYLESKVRAHAYFIPKRRNCFSMYNNKLFVSKQVVYGVAYWKLIKINANFTTSCSLVIPTSLFFWVIGDVCVPGNFDWRDGGSVVCFSRLLQFSSASSDRHRNHQLL